MFNNIIYIIVVLLIYNIGTAEGQVEQSSGYFFFAHLIGWLIFTLLCSQGFRGVVPKGAQGEGGHDLPGYYNRMIMRLSIAAVFLFALNVHMFNLRYWLEFIPGAEAVSVVPGILALSVFFLYLTTMWYFAYPLYEQAFGSVGKRWPFIVGNLRLNVPILFPWFAITFIYDLIVLTPWGGPEGIFGKTEAQLLFFSVFLFTLMIFLPTLVRKWWMCTPFPATGKAREIERFLEEQGFRYRGLLRWPLFGGRMLTAGIMGIVPRYRYILLSDGLMALLPMEELKAVMAHEMAHAKHKHLLFYVLFFLGFVAVSFGLFDSIFYVLASRPYFIEAFQSGNQEALKLFQLLMAVPVLIAVLVYFRFVMGFFMRNFERQADLAAAVTMGDAAPVARALERIAEAGGKVRDVPSWHHFSIRERVEYLAKAAFYPGIVKRHSRFVSLSLLVYLVGVIWLGWFLNFSEMKQNMPYRLMAGALTRQIQETPGNPLLYMDLAMVYHHMGNYAKAVSAYEKSLDLGPETAVALNNLAWILLTASDKSLQDEERALKLAEMAVAMERAAPFLDTLAEAHYANGNPWRALSLIEEALKLEGGRKQHYLHQHEKFRAAVEKKSSR